MNMFKPQRAVIAATPAGTMLRRLSERYVIAKDIPFIQKASFLVNEGQRDIRPRAVLYNLSGFNPDPSIIRHGDDFYIVTSSFEFTPGLPIYHSKNLVDWTLINHVLTRKSQLNIRTPEPGSGIWAPTIREHNGEFYVTVCSFDRYRPQADDRVWPRGFYVKTKDLWKKDSFSDPIYFDMIGFDQDLFWDDDGKVYLSSTYRMNPRTPVTPQIKDFAVHICTVDLETGTSTSQTKLIRSSSSGIAEGSHILKRGKYYYLFTAEGGTEDGHSEWVSRSETGPFGPWELGKSNPLWRNATEDEVQNTGHADFVEDKEGRWWAVFLGVRPLKIDNEWKPSPFGRETFLVPMIWEDDWPIINGGQKIQLQPQAPGLFLKEHDATWRDDFKDAELGLGWYRKNTPDKHTDTSLSATPGKLTLFGGPYDLSTPACPTAWFRKQSSRRVTWSTTLDFDPVTTRSEAGTVVYMNYFTYTSIGIRRATDSEKRIIRFRPAKQAVKDVELSTTGPVKLLIKSDDLSYTLGYQESGAKEVWLGDVDIDTMTSDPAVGAAFTGMMFGLYAFGELEPALAPAIFEYAEFQQ